MGVFGLDLLIDWLIDYVRNVKVYVNLIYDMRYMSLDWALHILSFITQSSQMFVDKLILPWYGNLKLL